MCSNGWDDVTAALQLLSHLDGDALNVALLVPESPQDGWQNTRVSFSGRSRVRVMIIYRY